MSLHDATQIVSRLGPSSVVIDREAEPVLARELALLGCIVVDAADPAAQGRIRFVRWSAGDEPAMPAGQAETLVVASVPGSRREVEAVLFASGWSRHPGGLAADDPIDADTLPSLAYFDRADGEDLLRRGDTDADAAIARFALAAEIVRSGDRVLVAGHDAAAGARIVAALSRARDVEAGEIAVAHAPASFDALVIVADAGSIRSDVLDLAARTLKPDGRLILSWREDGRGVAAIAAAVDDRFISERWAVQRMPSGGGAVTLLRGTSQAAAGDWVVLTASADPLAGAHLGYRHPAFHGDGQDAAATLVDIAGAYDNPHLYRAMVQVGERLGDEVKLARLAECVLEEARPGSADRGAAIAVLGYRVLDLRLTMSMAAVTGLIETYLGETEPSQAPHVLRWRLSLLFLAGRLAELAGDPAAALGWFKRASLADWAGFSPLLATKAIAGCFHTARLHLAGGDRAAAMACFRRGLDTALAAAAAPHDRLIGNRDHPVPFYCQEMAEVLDMGAQCAAALTHAHLLDRDPGLFWRQIDVRRFGLFAWADGLARENARLRAA